MQSNINVHICISVSIYIYIEYYIYIYMVSGVGPSGFSGSPVLGKRVQGLGCGLRT